jgi:hypothetical protein
MKRSLKIVIALMLSTFGVIVYGQNENVKVDTSEKESKQAPTYSISGKITGIIQNGVTVKLDSNHITKTDKEGNYKFCDLALGKYKVLPSLRGHKFLPEFLLVNLVDSDVANINFESKNSKSGSEITDPTQIEGCTMWLDGADPNGNGLEYSGLLEWWINKADSKKSAYQPYKDKQPEVVSKAKNGHSVLDYKKDGEHTMTIWDAANSAPIKIVGQTYFWVVKAIENGKTDPHFLLGDFGDTQFHAGIGDVNVNWAADGKIWDETYSAEEVRRGKTYLDGKKIDGVNNVLPKDEYHIVTLETTAPLVFNQITQDRFALAPRSWIGNIAEIIVYKGELSDKDRNSVESYLKKKWFDSDAVK